MSQDYTDVFRDVAAVDRYEHVTYAPASYATRISDRQRAYLRALVRRRFGADRAVQHDFACGTGRAVRALHGLVRAAHGYDTSAEMMAKAVEVGARAHWHQVAADGPVPVPVDAGRPAIVTMFRLMLNASDEVRDRAVAFAAKALPDADAGLLVLENHGNAASLRHLRARRHLGRRWFAELSHDDVAAHLGRHGFRIVERRGFALLTPGCYRRAGLTGLARATDAAARLPGMHRFAVNVVYVAERTVPPPMSGMDARRAPGTLESEVMGVLWARGRPSTAAEVQTLLGGEPAYNTVQTILTRLHEKRLVSRERLGRGHVYWPVEDAATTAAGRMRAALADRPDRQAVLRQFAASLDDADAETLRRLLSATQRRRRS